MFKALFSMQDFWMAFWGVAQTIVLGLIPGVPPEVIVGLDALVVALIASNLIEGDIRGLASRRVLFAAVGAVAVILGWAGVSATLWMPIEGFAIALIEAFAIRDRIEGRMGG